jgi:hypothetical protein
VRKPKPEPAQALRRGFVAAADHRERDGGGRERQVEEEDPAPGNPLHERASCRGAEDGGDARERRPEADRPTGLRPVDRTEERERVGREEGAGDALEGAREDQHCFVRRGAGEERGEREARRAGDEDRPAAVAVADCPADEVESGKRQRVGQEDPLLAGQPQPEVLLDRGERNDDDGRVDERERRAEDGRRECQASPCIEPEGVHGAEDTLRS